MRYKDIGIYSIVSSKLLCESYRSSVTRPFSQLLKNLPIKSKVELRARFILFVALLQPANKNIAKVAIIKFFLRNLKNLLGQKYLSDIAINILTVRQIKIPLT